LVPSEPPEYTTQTTALPLAVPVEVTTGAPDV